MSSKYSSKSRPKSRTKTLYTPVFYATSQSSGSGSTPRTGIPGAYLDSLSRKHVALSQLVEEVPSSRCGSPNGGEDSAAHSASKARVDALQRRVQEAYKYANGDPADGKWGMVVQLLRLPTARRTRWLGSTTEGEPAESSIGWINARSEKEWEEWEGKFKQELLLKQKVQSWKQKVDEHLSVEFAPIVSISQDLAEADRPTEKKQSTKLEAAKVQRATTLQSVSSRESRNPSALGFPVVKRPSLTVIGKAKPPGKSRSNDAIAGPSKQITRNSEPLVGASSPLAEPPRRSIYDISETSFLPPSFPSQLNTSTPNAKTQRRRKPEPIAPAPPSSPLTTPPSVHFYGHQRTNPDISSSLPELPSTPTRNLKPTLTSPQIRPREKRPRSVTPQRQHAHALKKARTRLAAALPTSDGPVPPSTPTRTPAVQPPITPDINITPQHKQQLPKLTELLASSSKSKKAKPSPRSKTLKHYTRHRTSTSVSALELPPPLPAKLPDPDPQPAPAPEQDQEQEQEKEVEPENEADTETHDVVRPSIFGGGPDPDPYQLSYDMGLDPGMGLDLDYDMSSPAKSLSSLAAESDSDDNDDAMGVGMDLDLDVDMEGFDPPFTSTQAGGAGVGAGGEAKGGSGLGGWMGYNSQFDVDGKVDLVSKFIEKDIDFGGWLRDPSVDAEGVGSQ
ncbi:hypothetical protein D9615_002096 [Tricholomella constricta]|uniref:Uncharacterized protein n=1 Tax=Tricholomella constricta TaxID=117010 RepID=A0A8H5HPN5_9AGAR|nr:hypothetical protein D9615_002096 [Tricholomella constricta]